MKAPRARLVACGVIYICIGKMQSGEPSKQSQSYRLKATREITTIEISRDRSGYTRKGKPSARRKSLKTLVAGGGIEPPTLGL